MSRALIFHPLTVIVTALSAALLFTLAILRLGWDTRLVSYNAPIGIVFVMYLFSLVERPATRRQNALNAVILVGSLTRSVVPIPIYSGHALFLTYILLTSKSWLVRVAAVPVLIQVGYLKLFQWNDLTFIGGAIIASLAALIYHRKTDAVGA